MIQRIHAISTFPAQAWDDDHPKFRGYAKRFVDSFLAYWDIPLTVYYEPGQDTSNPHVTWRPLNDIEIPWPGGVKGFRQKFQRQAHTARFCCKVFAQYDQWRRSSDLFVFVDADVITFKPFPAGKLCPEWLDDKPIACLRRDRLSTETGFVIVDPVHPQWKKFADVYFNIYWKGEASHFGGGMDGYVFDEALKKSKVEVANLNDDTVNNHPFAESSRLNQYMDHLKGARKEKGYSKEHALNWYEQEQYATTDDSDLYRV